MTGRKKTEQNIFFLGQYYANLKCFSSKYMLNKLDSDFKIQHGLKNSLEGHSLTISAQYQLPKSRDIKKGGWPSYKFYRTV